jgi:tetratricopeptide (TPR) repeat protein
VLYTEACGHDSPDVAGTLLNIANVYNRQGKYDEALVEYEKSLDIKIQVVGHAHPAVADTKENIGYEIEHNFTK